MVKRRVRVGCFNRYMVDPSAVDFWAKDSGATRGVRHAWLNEEETVCRNVSHSAGPVDYRVLEPPTTKRCKRCEVVLGLDS